MDALEVINRTLSLKKIGLTDGQVKEVLIDQSLTLGENTNTTGLLTLISMGYAVQQVKENIYRITVNE